MNAVSGNESLLPASWRARPRSFAALMSLYESNYLRLNVIEQCPYTTTVGLTHLFRDPVVVGPGLETFLTYPDVRIRVYGDARMAQAQHWRSDRPEPYGRHPGAAGRELEQRWLFNNMLNKWLEYCLELGHSLV